jgi:hypothetical protein
VTSIDLTDAITPQPVFVVGAPRSGTSMMQWTLRAHPELWGGPESDFLLPLLEGAREAYESGTSRGDLHWLSQQEVSFDEFLGYLGLGINALYTDRSGGLRWVEQTPQYTLHLADIFRLFPDARAIVMVRDGRDVVHSLRHFVNPVEHSEASALWQRFTEAGIGWGDRGPTGQSIVVRHENIVSEPEREVRRILDFLDLDFAQGCVDHLAKGRINSSFDSDEERAAGWREWNRTEKKVFQQNAGQLLIDLGYEPGSEWAQG